MQSQRLRLAFEKDARLRAVRTLANERAAVTLADAANAAQLSRSHFSNYFKRKTGTIFWKWLRRDRLEKVIRQLDEDPRTPLHDLPKQVGFSSMRSMERAFLAELKTTAARYKTERRRKPTVNSGEPTGRIEVFLEQIQGQTTIITRNIKDSLPPERQRPLTHTLTPLPQLETSRAPGNLVRRRSVG